MGRAGAANLDVIQEVEPLGGCWLDLRVRELTIGRSNTSMGRELKGTELDGSWLQQKNAASSLYSYSRASHAVRGFCPMRAEVCEARGQAGVFAEMFAEDTAACQELSLHGRALGSPCQVGKPQFG